MSVLRCDQRQAIDVLDDRSALVHKDMHLVRCLALLRINGLQVNLRLACKSGKLGSLIRFDLHATLYFKIETTCALAISSPCVALRERIIACQRFLLSHDVGNSSLYDDFIRDRMLIKKYGPFALNQSRIQIGFRERIATNNVA